MGREGQTNRGSFKKGHLVTEETRRRMAKSHLGKKRKPFSEECRINMSRAKKGKKPNNYGKKQSMETRLKKSKYMKCIKNNPNWKDGKSHLKKTIRNQIMLTFDYKLWREEVFKRDNWTCQKCGLRGKRLEAHHIKSWDKFPKLRFYINNGLTLCKRCHIKEHVEKEEQK